MSQKVSFGLQAACFVLGGATQTSFFMVFFSVDYFNYFFGNLQPEFFLSLSLSVLSLLGVLATLAKPYFISYRVTLLVCYAASALTVALIPILVELNLRAWISQSVAYWSIVLIIGLLGFFQSVCGGSLFSLFGVTFDSWAVQLAQAGTTWIGSIILVIRLITKASFTPTEHGFRLSGIAEFSAIAGIQFICVLFVAPITRPVKKQQLSTGLLEADEPASVADLRNSRGNSVAEIKQQLATIFRMANHHIVGMTIGLILNQAFYPGVFSVAKGSSHGWSILGVFGCFAVGDTIGQTLPARLRLFPVSRPYSFPVTQLLLIGPLALVLQHHFAADILHSWAALSVMGLIWGFSVGTGVCCSMMAIMELVSAESKPRAGTFAVVTLQLGLAIASALGVGIKSVIFA